MDVKKLPPAKQEQEQEELVWTDAPYDAPKQELTAEQKWPSEWHQVCWMSASGVDQITIAQKLNYTRENVSLILNKRSVQEKIESIRREFMGSNSLEKRFNEVAPKAAEFMASVIEGKEFAKTNERMDASKWMLEQVVGKAGQKGGDSEGGTLLQLLQQIDKMRVEKTEGRAVSELPDIEQEPTETPAQAWVRNNLKGKK